MKKLLFALSIFAFSSMSYAQKNYEKDADVAFTNREYYKASELYKKAYTKAKKDKKGLVLYKTAECYRLMGETKQSEMFYAKAIKGKYTDPIATLRLADAIKIQGRYTDAIVEYNNYKKLAPSDKRGEDGAKSCEMAQKWKDKPTRYEVANMSQINSSESDFGPAYADNKKYTSLLFTSTRKGATGGDMDNTIGQTFSDIFTTKVDKNGKWSEPVTLSEPINSQYNEGASVITKKGNLMFFTRCGVQKKKEEKCQIYIAVKKGNTWGEPELLPFNIDSFAFGHPTISADEQTLIFASDIQGGKGGKDIWMSEYDKKAKKWGNPVNLGADINTPGDEMYPFLTEDSVLYFASNGHMGMGGLDIFKTEKSGYRKWSKVTNMKYPMNSPGDDFAIIFEGKKQKGYFTSNREGGKGNDDIWSFNLPALQFSIDGVVTDCKSKESLQNAIVRLTGSDGSSVDLKTDKAGYYKYAENGKERYVNENTTYTITVLAGDAKTDKSPKGYLNTTRKDQETTVGVEEAKNFKHDFCLTPIEKEIRFPEVLYDLNKADLRPESKDSLNFLYQTLVDNPTLVIELSAHTDSRASDAYNMKLSDARAKSCVDYLISKGIPKARMVPKGYGESRLINTDAMIAKEKDQAAQEALHQKNRRTVFTVLRKDYVDPNAPKELPKLEKPQEKKEEADEEDK